MTLPAWIERFAVRTPTLPPATHTNVYVCGEQTVAVVDPASPYPEEQSALDRFLDGRAVQVIVLTHHHVDHVSGALHLAERLSLPLWAHAETAARLSGRVEVARLLKDGDQIELGSHRLEVLHTPGHAPGHICLADRQSGTLIVGDMVASIGTIIIEPDDGGDMRAYLQSLERLRQENARLLLPSHGDPITQPHAHLSFYLAHRMQREARVLAALDREPRSISQLVPASYADVSPSLYGLAERSLLAHLLKLEAEGRVWRDGDKFSLLD